MSDNRHDLIAALNSSFMGQRYSPVLARNSCTHAFEFVDYQGLQAIPIADMIVIHVEQYLRRAIVLFEIQRCRDPCARWHKVSRSGIHALLRIVYGQWPPAIEHACAADQVHFSICVE